MPVLHNRVILSGTIGSSEVWSTSVAFIGTDPTPLTVVDSAEDLQAWAQTIADGLDDIVLGELQNQMGAVVTLEGVKTELKAGPTLVQQSTVVPCSVAGGGSSFMPWSTAIVLSLVGNQPGARHRGRMYWPGVGAAVSSTGLIAGNIPLADSAVDLLHYIAASAAPYAEVVPGVYSTVADAVTAVTAVRVGNKPDHQKSRQDHLLESYATSVY